MMGQGGCLNAEKPTNTLVSIPQPQTRPLSQLRANHGSALPSAPCQTLPVGGASRTLQGCRRRRLASLGAAPLQQRIVLGQQMNPVCGFPALAELASLSPSGKPVPASEHLPLSFQDFSSSHCSFQTREAAIFLPCTSMIAEREGMQTVALRPSPMPDLVNKVLLEHAHAHVFRYRL